MFGTYTLAPYLLGFHIRVHGNTLAPAFANKAENVVALHEEVTLDVFSPTVQMILPLGGLNVEGFVELSFRKVILIWYFVMWERLGGGRVSPKFPMLSRALEEGCWDFIPLLHSCHLSLFREQ